MAKEVSESGNSSALLPRNHLDAPTTITSDKPTTGFRRSPALEKGGQGCRHRKKHPAFAECFWLNRQLPILPDRFQSSTFGV